MAQHIAALAAQAFVLDRRDHAISLERRPLATRQLTGIADVLPVLPAIPVIVVGAVAGIADDVADTLLHDQHDIVEGGLLVRQGARRLFPVDHPGGGDFSPRTAAIEIAGREAEPRHATAASAGPVDDVACGQDMTGPDRRPGPPLADGPDLAGGAPREGVVVEQVSVVRAEDRTAEIESLAPAGAELMGGLVELRRERRGDARRAISVDLLREQLGVELPGIEARHRNALIAPFRTDSVAVDRRHEAEPSVLADQARVPDALEREVEERRGRALGFPDGAKRRSSGKLAVRQRRDGLLVRHDDPPCRRSRMPPKGLARAGMERSNCSRVSVREACTAPT